jgi:hypothetical protein
VAERDPVVVRQGHRLGPKEVALRRLGLLPRAPADVAALSHAHQLSSFQRAGEIAVVVPETQGLASQEQSVGVQVLELVHAAKVAEIAARRPRDLHNLWTKPSPTMSVEPNWSDLGATV